MIRLNRSGFTLVEIMIVVAIIALLAAIAIPNLLRARLNANESAGIATLQTLSSALQSFQAANPATGFPATLLGLAPAGEPPYVDGTLAVAAPSRQGFNFAYTPGGGVPVTQYHISATPITANVTGIRGFYIDEQGVVSFISPAAGDPGHAAAGAVMPAGYTVLQ
jgi:type IV pilus assembly protein PilA